MGHSSQGDFSSFDADKLRRSESSDTGSGDLVNAYSELAELTAKVERLASAVGENNGHAGAQFHNRSAALAVATEIRNRARRATLMPSDLFADPAWDMLLELYRGALHQFRVSISRLCIASHVPASTALRWINHLETIGLVERRPDMFDARRSSISLTVQGESAMHSYFSNGESGPGATLCAV